jgi:signal transduction histidine kinase
MAYEAVSPARVAPHPRRRPLLVSLGVLLVVVVVVLEVLLVGSYGETERTTRDFRRTTDAATGIANAQREMLLLAEGVDHLADGDPLAPLQMRRGLLERQLNVVEAAVPDGVALRGRVEAMRERLRDFDRAFTEAYGDGPRVRGTPARDSVGPMLRELNLQFKETFDEAEHSLYSALGQALQKRTHGQLLILGLSVLVLLGAAALGLVLWRVVRGNFARAYDMLARTEARLERLVGQLPAIVYALELGEDGRSARTLYVSPQVEQITGVRFSELPPALHLLAAHVPEEDRRRIAAELAAIAAGASPRPIEFRFEKPGGEVIWLRDSEPAVDGRQLHGLLFDVTDEKRAEAEREQMELGLRLAQKLEAVGQLAAGIAHEINTPIQFVGDTVGFLEDAFSDLLTLQAVQDELHGNGSAHLPAELLARLHESKESADLEYLRERVPMAFERAADGIARVATIVRAMREFAHPPTSEQAPVDLNEALRNTLIVAASEYKYVADVETALGELPPVTCNGGDVNQVFLNLLVNAAHAIEEHVGESGNRGSIRIRTWREGDHAVVSIGDSGCGIPADIADRVFDPFFTTKEVGRGTGQGLAIARTLVVERHAGTLSFETESGGGTTFEIQLPIAGVQSGTDAQAVAA